MLNDDTTGHEAVRISIVFCAFASGKKLPALVIIPRATPLPGFVPPENVIVLYRTASTFNGEVLRDQFLKRVLFPFMDREGFGSSRLVIVRLFDGFLKYGLILILI